MLVVRPPEYWPRLSYFALMAQADTFVLADTFQYSRQSFQNRTRLRNPDGWQWISVPLKGGQHGAPIEAVRIRDHLPWRRQHLRALHYNYHKAPYFSCFMPDVEALLDQPWQHLGALACATVGLLRDLLGLPTRLTRASAMKPRPTTVEAVIANKKLIIPEDVQAVDGHLATHLHTYVHPTYHQNFNGFAPEMSVLDLLFNYGPASADLLMQGSDVVPRADEQTPVPR